MSNNLKSAQRDPILRLSRRNRVFTGCDTASGFQSGFRSTTATEDTDGTSRLPRKEAALPRSLHPRPEYAPPLLIPLPPDAVDFQTSRTAPWSVGLQDLHSTPVPRNPLPFAHSFSTSREIDSGLAISPPRYVLPEPQALRLHRFGL